MNGQFEYPPARTTVLASLIAAGLLAIPGPGSGIALARDGADTKPAPGVQPGPPAAAGEPLEKLDQGFLPTSRDDHARTPGMRAMGNGFVSVQVNVDENGNNIVGDAANEPSIAVDPNNSSRAAIGWRQFDTTASNFRQAGWGHTSDGGRTWTFPGVIEPGIFRSDPVLDSDADGVFYYNSLTLEGNDFYCNVFRSVDGGQTWDGGVFAEGGDKQWMTIDKTNGIGRGNIYANWTVFYSICPDEQFTRSYDQGDSYMDCIDVPGTPYWGTLTVDATGALYIAGGAGVVVKSSSLKDQLQPPAFDFASPIDLGGELQISTGPNPSGLLGQMWIDVDRSNGPNAGNVYVVSSVDPQGGDPLDVHFMRSTDGGQNWSAPLRINDVADGWQWFGTMSVAPNGRIDVIWNDTRNDPGGYLSELHYTSSSDGGDTWLPAVAVGPPFDPHLGWPQQNKIGDYYDMVSDRVGAHVAYSATYNGEQDVYFVRIGDYDCNDNGIGDTDDIAMGTSDDLNADGIPDECQCVSDIDGDGFTGFADLLELLAAWGPCVACPEDLDGNGEVAFQDLLILLANWGPCV